MVCGTIIFDKSAIQSFSRNELRILHRYYQYVMTPVLALEFAGDLAKRLPEGKDALEDATILAHKINPRGTSMNRRYEEIIITEMIDGVDIPDYRPIPKGHIETREDGERVFVVEQSEEERMLEEWKSGTFDPDLIDASESYRKYLSTNPTEQRKNTLKNIQYGTLAGLSLDQNRDIMKRIYSDNGFSYEAINVVLENFAIHEEYHARIWDRWTKSGMPNLETMSKYAFFCTVVENTFDAALALGLIGTKSSNVIDLQYLYYLPFTRVFVSGDNLHSELAPIFMDSYQRFLKADDLKQDLWAIDEYLSTLSAEEHVKYEQYPPDISGSITYDLAQSNVLPEDVRINRLRSDADTEADEVVVDKRISIFSECFCGSGKLAKDCHAPCDCKSGKRMSECHPR